MGVIAVASAILFGGVGVVVAQVRCIDAAREAARLVARGDPARAESAARDLAPSGALIAVTVAGDEVIVEVSAEPVAGLLPGLTVRAEAMAVLEPGVAEPGVGTVPGAAAEWGAAAEPGMAAKRDTARERGAAVRGAAVEPGMAGAT